MEFAGPDDVENCRGCQNINFERMTRVLERNGLENSRTSKGVFGIRVWNGNGDGLRLGGEILNRFEKLNYLGFELCGNMEESQKISRVELGKA